MYEKAKLLEENNPYYRNVGKELIYNLLQNHTKQSPAQGDKPQRANQDVKIVVKKNVVHNATNTSSGYDEKKQKKRQKKKTSQPFPVRTDDPLRKAHTDHKNKIDLNIRNVKNMKTKNSSIYSYVDDNKGTKSCHINSKTTSGLLPVFGRRIGLGKIPKYLENMKRVREETARAKSEFIHEQIQSENGRKLSEEERVTYLKGLKKNLEKLTHEYYSMGIVMPTKEKHIRYRESLEKKMEELENCITLLCNNKTIIIPT